MRNVSHKLAVLACIAAVSIGAATTSAEARDWHKRGDRHDVGRVIYDVVTAPFRLIGHLLHHKR
jgi:hypothetical protein